MILRPSETPPVDRSGPGTSRVRAAGVRAHGWRWYLLGAGLVCVLCVLTSGVAHSTLLALVSCSSAVAIGVGTWLHRPQRAGAWWLMAAGMGAWAIGDVAYAIVYDVLGSQAYPAPPDVAYLLAYPLLGTALLGLARQARTGRDVTGLVDAAILAVGTGLLSWTFLVRPALATLHEDVLGGLVTAAYPVADVFVFAMLVRLLSAAGTRSTSFRMLAAAAVLMLVGDVGYQVSYAVVGHDSSALDPVWLAGYVLWGAAALHPSMLRLSDPDPEQREDISALRLFLLAGASLLAPGTLAVQLLLQLPLEAWAVAACSSVLFLLVVFRMSLLLRRNRSQAAELASLARTDVLTGLPNRRSGEEELRRHAAEAAAGGGPLVVALLDLDQFKQYNDTLGHPAGDALLHGAAAAWRAGLAGTGAVLSRWGGEEFLVSVVGHDVGEVEARLEVLRAATPSGQSFSAGLARRRPGEELGELLGRCDTALYAAKAAGRRRSVVAQDVVAEVAGAAGG